MVHLKAKMAVGARDSSAFLSRWRKRYDGHKQTFSGSKKLEYQPFRVSAISLGFAENYVGKSLICSNSSFSFLGSKALLIKV